MGRNMNLDSIKQAICVAIPSDVNVSNVEVVEGDNGKLSVQVSWDVKKWDVKKASEPDPIKLPSLDRYQAPEWWTRDGYCRPLINLDQQVPLSLIAGLPSVYREKMKAEFEKSEHEANQLRAEKAELWTADAERVLELLTKKIINPTKAADPEFLSGLREVAKKLTIDDVQKSGNTAPRIPKGVNFVATRGTDQYEKALVRAGMDPLTAKEMANGVSWMSSPIPPQKTPKTTFEGKVVTPIDLPLPNKDPHVPFPATKEQVAEVREKIGHHRFRRAEADDQATVIVNNKPKVIDGYQRPRFVKTKDEVIAEFKKAVEKYEARYAKFRSPLALKPNANNKGKRGIAALTAHSLPFLHKDRKVTDVEILFLANEKMAKLTEPASLWEDMKAMEAKLPRQTKLQKILFHLRSIKHEILGK
jgi:hypothetical protein